MKKSKNKGITLIALVVTIVVLLILAGISISMLTGENGVITQARKSKEETIIGDEKEGISLAYSSCKAENMMENVTASQLEEKMKANGKDVTVIQEELYLKVKYSKTGHEYTVNQNGKIEGITKNDENIEQPKYKVNVQAIHEITGEDILLTNAQIQIFLKTDTAYENPIFIIEKEKGYSKELYLPKGDYIVYVKNAPYGYAEPTSMLEFNVEEKNSNKWIIKLKPEGAELPATGDKSIFQNWILDNEMNEISSKNVSLSVVYEDRGGVKLELIPIGEYDKRKNKYVMDGEIASILEIENKYNNCFFIRSAKVAEVYKYIKKQGLNGVTKVTDSSGKASFNDIGIAGVFLVKTSLSEQCDFIISMPYFLENEGHYNNNITLYHERRIDVDGNDTDDAALGIIPEKTPDKLQE